MAFLPMKLKRYVPLRFHLIVFGYIRRISKDETCKHLPGVIQFLCFKYYICFDRFGSHGDSILNSINNVRCTRNFNGRKGSNSVYCENLIKIDKSSLYNLFSWRFVLDSAQNPSHNFHYLSIGLIPIESPDYDTRALSLLNITEKIWKLKDNNFLDFTVTIHSYKRSISLRSGTRTFMVHEMDIKLYINELEIKHHQYTSRDFDAGFYSLLVILPCTGITMHSISFYHDSDLN